MALSSQSIQRAGGLSLATDFSVKDIRQLQRRLRDIEPGLRTQFMRDIKQIAFEPNKAIKNAIPSIPPLSGMAGDSRVSWGKGKPAKSTTVRFRTASSSKSLTTTLLSIRVNSIATSIADMAGRSGRSVGRGYRGSGYTREFVKRRRDGSTYLVRRRTTAAAGRKFISNLNEDTGNTASRFAWKSVENNLPALNRRVGQIVKKYERIANYRMVRG